MPSGSFVRVAPQKGALSAALRAAEPNMTLLLSSGVYVELDNLVCDVEGVSILGIDGMDSTENQTSTIMGDLAHLDERAFFEVTAARFLMRNVNIEVSSSAAQNSENPKACDAAACVLVSKGSEAIFDHCRISSEKRLVGLSIEQYSRPSITFCDIANNKW
jgi:hypothetical protein